MDEYTFSMILDLVFYFKNNKLHKENGPAIVNKKSNKYNLEDESLYKKVEHNPEIISGFFLLNADNCYYLEGINYTKEEFDRINKRKTLKIELDSQLNQSQLNIKKIKI